MSDHECWTAICPRCGAEVYHGTDALQAAAAMSTHECGSEQPEWEPNWAQERIADLLLSLVYLEDPARDEELWQGLGIGMVLALAMADARGYADVGEALDRGQEILAHLVAGDAPEQLADQVEAFLRARSGREEH